MDTPLPDEAGFMLEMYGAAEFSRDVMEALPHLRDDLMPHAGLLHVQMGTLAEAVRRSLRSGDEEAALRVCTFIDTALKQPRAIAEIENAVAISFITASELRETQAGRTFLTRMPEALRRILTDQDNRSRA